MYKSTVRESMGAVRVQGCILVTLMERAEGWGSSLTRDAHHRLSSLSGGLILSKSTAQALHLSLSLCCLPGLSYRISKEGHCSSLLTGLSVSFAAVVYFIITNKLTDIEDICTKGYRFWLKSKCTVVCTVLRFVMYHYVLQWVITSALSLIPNMIILRSTAPMSSWLAWSPQRVCCIFIVVFVWLFILL